MEEKLVCESNSTLIVDAGNTRVKWTLFKGDRITDKWAQETPSKDRIGSPKNIVLASVRSAEHDAVLTSLIHRSFPESMIHSIQSESEACGVINSYVEPSRLGVDRWLAIIAAYHIYGGPLVVIDAGTAIKADFVSEEGVHLGGYIVPGIELMQSSLVSQTAKIRYDAAEVTLEEGVPNSTAGAVSAGCLEMALGFIQRLYAKHEQAKWLATGGGSQALMKRLSIDYVLDEHLVAKGAKFVLDARMKGAK